MSPFGADRERAVDQRFGVSGELLVGERTLQLDRTACIRQQQIAGVVQTRGRRRRAKAESEGIATGFDDDVVFEASIASVENDIDTRVRA